MGQCCEISVDILLNRFSKGQKKPLTNLLRYLFSTPLKFPATREAERYRLVCNSQLRRTRIRSGRNTHNKIGKRLVQMYDPQTLKEEGKLVRTNNWHYARHVR